MKPQPSRIFCVETKSYLKLTPEQAKEFYHNGVTLRQGTIRCAAFKKKNDPKTYLQPWAWLSFLRKKGEENINAKLNNAQVIQIYDRVTKPKGDADTVVALANEFKVDESTIRDIEHLRSWRHILVPHLKPKAAAALTAHNNAKGTKISAGIARFIARDNILHKIPVKVLAKKYNLSDSSIRRIVTGKAWKEATKDILKEVKKWLP